MATVTPMMQQYLILKEKYKDSLVFYRLGDFYEMFFDDAVTAARELELVLTGRDCGLEERAPMCGVPFHAVDTYVARLIQKGYKVAICEQLTEPGNGLVERDVVRVITPGTVIEPSMLDEKKNNFILSVTWNNKSMGLSWCDVSTGEFYIKEIPDGITALKSELEVINPVEVIANETMLFHISGSDSIFNGKSVNIGAYKDWAYDYQTALNRLLQHFNVSSLDAYGCSQFKVATCAAGALMEYLYETQKTALTHINRISIAHTEGVMVIDTSTRRNLELVQTIRSNSRRGSLLWLLDKTFTAMGGRKLLTMTEQPLCQIDAINARLDAVEALIAMPEMTELVDALKKIYDIERLCSKLSYGTVNPKDCLSLLQSLENIPAVKKASAKTKSKLVNDLSADIDEMQDISEKLSSAIDSDAPPQIKDGGIIKGGYDERLDQLRDISHNGKKLIANLEASEREASGIKNLKIGFNKVFGYYIEVTQSYYDQVPYTYIRKQTLANCERFITPELKELEEKILNAEEEILALEYKLFIEIRDFLSAQIQRIQVTAHAIAYLDALQSLANVAKLNNYVRPVMTTDGRIAIRDGRHPVVEEMLPSGSFVPNDTLLDTDENRMMIITGPNMAGKSTYMRQVAMIALMAQMGSFVPARSATISVSDRIFTRVGAADDLSSGQSTFMVEMNEVANILHNATSKSLIILDEIGRGTSTYDGLSIAWAVVEYIRDKRLVGAKTLFSTHYHELTELEKTLSGVKNYSVSVKEMGDDIIFLRKIVRGGTDKSFGVYVAKLAGLPNQVINRSKIILNELDGKQIEKKKDGADKKPAALEQQLGLLGASADSIIEKLKKLNISQLTPINAMNTLYELSEEAKEIK